MLALRQAHHGAGRGAPAGGEPARASRGEVAAALDSIRERFFSDPADGLAGEIASLDVEGRPDLAAAVRRFRNVLALREELEALERATWMPRHFREPWIRSLLAPPTEAVAAACGATMPSSGSSE